MELQRLSDARFIIRAWSPPQFLGWLSYYAVEVPFLYLFLYGPSVMGAGFWEGKEMHVICSEVTQIDARHWLANEEECELLVMRKFVGWLVVVHTVLYCAFLWCVFVCAKKLLAHWLSACCRRCGNDGAAVPASWNQGGLEVSEALRHIHHEFLASLEKR